MANERRTQWMCLFLEDLKTYAADRGLVETAAAIEAAVHVAEQEIANTSTGSPTSTPAPRSDRDKLQ